MKTKPAATFEGFIDTTLRDGQQSPLMFDSRKYLFTIEDKKTLVQGLVALGVRHFEFFSPAVGWREKEDFQILKEYIRTLTEEKIHLLAHVRCHASDISQAIEAGFDGLNMYIGIAERAQKYSHGYSFSDILRLVTETIRSIRAGFPDLYIRFSVEDCFRTPLRDTYRMYDAISEYVNTFGMPDTVGAATPEMVRAVVGALKKRYPRVALEGHFHNDRGLSLINSLTAIESGVSFIDTSIWGLAERSGIASITGLLLNLHFEYPEYCSSYKLEHCYPLNVLMGSILKLHVPYNEPVSVTNRTHTAGVHQKAVLNHRMLYEAHDLEQFGVTKNQLLLGPLSGWNLIYYYLREIEYMDVTPEQAKDIAGQFKQEASRMSKKLKPEVLIREIAAQWKLPYLPMQAKILEKRIENL